LLTHRSNGDRDRDYDRDRDFDRDADLERERDCESGHDHGRDRAWNRRSNSMAFQKLDVHVAAKEIARLFNEPHYTYGS
jgi:hypothetical protein